MRIDLFDMDEFIEINHLQEITSPVLFERGGIPNPNGLVSNDIFGVSVKSRKETFAYINLHGHFFHPHIYKIIKRVFRNIDKIVNGEEYYSIDAKGNLVKDNELGYTGIDFLYNNWEKIKWEGNAGMSTERTNLIKKSKKNEVFITKMIVIPPFYRDISSSRGGGGETLPINDLYTRLIRMGQLINDRDMFDFSFHGTNFNIQNTLVDIYDYFKDKLDKKNGLLRKYLLGKNVDYCVRTVISAPTFVEDHPENNMVDFTHAAVPISQVCVLCYPFMVAWLRNFFEREVIENKAIKYYTNTNDEGNEFPSLKNPESYFNDTYIKKAIDRFVKDPSSRYDKIMVPTYSDKPKYLWFNGRYADQRNEKATIANRPMTWTDLLFIASCDITKDKHVMITRYPILDSFGIFLSRIRVASTLKTTPVEINSQVYRWYPYIDLSMTKSQVSNNFIDTTRFSNSYLEGLDGDYDGDQITAKILWTQEANAECEKAINSKSFILSPNGKNMRTCDIEAIQTFYVLTKDPIKS
jgi:DNA-directed RNA polymerase beta' subunit